MKEYNVYETRKSVRQWLRDNPDKENPDYPIMVNAVIVLTEALEISEQPKNPVHKILRK